MPKVCPWSKYNHECKKQCKNPGDPNDPQKERVYCWEEMLHEHVDEKENSLTLDQCRDIISNICLRYAILPPIVTDGRGLRTARSNLNRIALPCSYRERITSVHEACHVLTSYQDPRSESHGSVFVRNLVMNLPRYLSDFYSTATLEKCAKQFGLEVASSLEYVPPSFHVVSGIIRQFKLIKGYQNSYFHFEKRCHESKKFERAAERKLFDLAMKIQNQVWPDMAKTS